MSLHETQAAIGAASTRKDTSMAASLRLGRQGILIGLRLVKLKKCPWTAHTFREQFRSLFQSPSFFGK